VPTRSDTRMPVPRGLSPEQVAQSRRRHGANVLTPARRDPWWRLYLEKYDDPVIRLLLTAAVLAIGVGALEGDFIDGAGIIVAVLLATTLAFVNEYQARREFDILNKVTDESPTRVLRGGVYQVVPRKDIVVGDIVLLEAGEEVPADARVLESRSLQVDESKLTGESVPVEKRPEGEQGESTYPVDRVYRGTLVSDGNGVVEVFAVGDATEMGVTARAAAEDSGAQTPLNRQLARLSQVIGVLAFLIAAVVYGALLVRGHVTGELSLTPGQWYVALVLMTGGAVMLVRVWAPIVHDGLDLVGRARPLPGWLDDSSPRARFAPVLAGVLWVGVGMGLGLGAGWLPRDPTAWVSPAGAHEILRYFMIAVTLIVVAVPEGLAMSVTLSLAYSMRRMARTNSLVRRLHACETIGAATVICCDKTGTLTENRMKVYHVEASGVDLVRDGLEPASEEIRRLIEAMAVNSTAHLSRRPGAEVVPTGNPTEGALLLWLEGRGVDYQALRDRFLVTKQWPFNTERKFMGTLGRSEGEERTILYIKGAPEIVLQRCTREQVGGGTRPLDPARIEEPLRACQRRGMRTLGLAWVVVDEAASGDRLEDLAQGCTWIGFAALEDPVRPEVPEAIEACRKAGIEVKMVTGDNPETAREVARQAGLWEESAGEAQLIGGRRFEGLSDGEAAGVLRNLRVLARARPLDKLRAVRLLQGMQHVVAVTGDGTNDAPALNQADVGLAMGRSGTAVAKEASDIILLDDSFQSIVNAVKWGRSLYENIQRFILFQLTINVAACITALLGPFIGVKFPFTVTQMLWVNLIMDTMAALALATEPPHDEVMDRPPRAPDAFIITPAMARNIFITGGLFLLIMLGMLLVIREGGTTDRELSVFFTVFVLLQFWNLFNARSLGRTRPSLAGVWENRWFVMVALAIFLGQVLIVQFGGSLFRTTPLPGWAWIFMVAATSTVLWTGEVLRWRARRGEPAPS